MLKIRLARVGKKKSPSYRFVVSESSKDTYGKSVEIVGHYNPFTKVCEVSKDRILYWISKGAQPSATVYNMLLDQNVIVGKKVKASKGKKKNEPAITATSNKPTEVATPVVEQPAPTESPATKPAEAPVTELIEKPKSTKTEKKPEPVPESTKEKTA